jgi:hypothetical protein
MIYDEYTSTKMSSNDGISIVNEDNEFRQLPRDINAVMGRRQGIF